MSNAFLGISSMWWYFWGSKAAELLSFSKLEFLLRQLDVGKVVFLFRTLYAVKLLAQTKKLYRRKKPVKIYLWQCQNVNFTKIILGAKVARRLDQLKILDRKNSARLRPVNIFCSFHCLIFSGSEVLSGVYIFPLLPFQPIPCHIGHS